MRSLGDRLLAEQHRNGSRRTSMFRSRKWAEDPVFSRVVERVARLTLLPAHRDETIMYKVLGGPGSPAPSGTTVRNAHHDLNNAPNRVATVLVYLTDLLLQVPTGHTIFPCIPAQGSGAAGSGFLPPAERDLCDTLRRGSLRGHRSLPGFSNKKCWNQTAVTQLQRQCDAPEGQGAALRVAPAKGTAVLFPNRLRDGSPDLNTWHAACPLRGTRGGVGGGNLGEKVTLQFFKELPRVGGQWEHRIPPDNDEIGSDAWVGRPLTATATADSGPGPADGAARFGKILANFDRNIEHWKS